MITIEIVHEYEEKTEKPQNPQPMRTAYAVHPGAVDAIYHLAHERQQTLIRAAHAARLANVAKQGQAGNPSVGSQLPVDVQRYAEKNTTTSTILERYARRALELVLRS